MSSIREIALLVIICNDYAIKNIHIVLFLANQMIRENHKELNEAE